MTALVMNAADKIGWNTVSNFFKKLDAHFKAQRVARNTVRELSALTDHDLRDIGLHRGAIRTMAMEAYNMEKAKLDGRIV